MTDLYKLNIESDKMKGKNDHYKLKEKKKIITV